MIYSNQKIDQWPWNISPYIPITSLTFLLSEAGNGRRCDPRLKKCRHKKSLVLSWNSKVNVYYLGSARAVALIVEESKSIIDKGQPGIIDVMRRGVVLFNVCITGGLL